MKIRPDPEDYRSVEAEYGPLPESATDAECGEHYRLAQVTKVFRLWKSGKLDELLIERHIE